MRDFIQKTKKKK